MPKRFSAGRLAPALLLVLGVELSSAISPAQQPAPRVDAPPASVPAVATSAAPAWTHHVPAGTIAVLRARSIDALVAAVQEISLAVGEATDFDPAELLLRYVEADAALIARDREVAAAFVQAPGAPIPEFCFFLPSATPEQLAQSAAQDGAHAARIEDDYVLLSSAARNAERSLEPHPLALALLPGQISVQVDLEALIAANRMLIDVVLDDEEQGLGAEEMPPEFGERLFAFVHEMLDAALGFSCALRLEDGIVELEQRFTARAGNPYGSWFGAEAPALSTYRHLIDPEAGLSLLSSLDPRPGTELLLEFRDFILDAARAELAAEATPEQELALNWVQRFFEGWSAFAALCGKAQAVSFDFDAEQGPELELHTRGAAPDELASAHAMWLDWAHERASGLQLGPTVERELGGRNVRQWQLSTDAPAFLWLHETMVHEQDEGSAREFARLVSWLDSLALKLTYATRADEWLLAFGGDQFAARALQRADSRALPLDPAFERALERCGAGVPACIWRMDFARLFAWFEQLDRHVAGFADGPAKDAPRLQRPSRVHAWGTHGETEFAGGYVLDLGELGELVRAINASEAARAAAAVEPASAEAAPSVGDAE
jgi:hypothetical protein